MLSKKQKRLIALFALLLVVALIAANYFMAKANKPSQVQDPSRPTASAPATINESDSEKYMVRDAGEMCEELAPRTLHAYIDDTPDRSELLSRYFTPNAQGLTIPVSEIAKQPTDTFTGFLGASDDASATCSVATGLSAPWILHYTYSTEDGWMCDSVSGGMDGAYKTKEGKAPKASDSNV